MMGKLIPALHLRLYLEKVGKDKRQKGCSEMQVLLTHSVLHLAVDSCLWIFTSAKIHSIKLTVSN